MTVAEAAKQFVETDRQLKALEPQREAAREVLLAHFRKTGRSRYKDLIQYARSTRTVLDQAAVKRFLGKRLPRFQKSVLVESVSVVR